MRVLAPAKINLHLRVGGVDGSGYHPLASWVCGVGLFDKLSFAIEMPVKPPRLRGAPEGTHPAGAAASWDVQLRCDDPALPTNGRNLIVRAARALLDGALGAGRVTIDLAKRIPTGGGLGGGSGDAAATLVALDRLLGLRAGTDRLSTLAAAVGSDVPVFLHLPAAFMAGRGELVRPAPSPRPTAAVLLLPPIGIPTPAAYRRLDELRPAAPPDVLDPPDLEAWARLPARELVPRLVNDLEPAAFSLEPRLMEWRDAAERHLGRAVRMSGSGSTLFTLYDDPDEARDAAANASVAIKIRAEAVDVGRHRIDVEAG